MPITGLDHVNIRTAQLDQMVAWYTEILGLRSGPRPAFGFPGAWLYAGSAPVVHLVGVDAAPVQPDALSLEHFALKGTGLKTFLARLEAEQVAAEVSNVPGMPIVQVHLNDPEGNHIHVDFDAAEA